MIGFLTRFFFGFFLPFFSSYVFSEELLNEPLFILAEKAVEFTKESVLYDFESISSDLLVYSTNYGLFTLGGINGNSKILNSSVDRSNNNISKWGQIILIEKIDNKSFSFVNISKFPQKTDHYIYNLIEGKTEESIYKEKDSLVQMRSILSDEIKNKFPNLKIHCSSSDGRYIIFYEAVDKIELGYEGKYRFYKYEIANQEYSIMYESFSINPWLFVNNSIIITTTDFGLIVFDINGKILQWYSNIYVIKLCIDNSDRELYIGGHFYNEKDVYRGKGFPISGILRFVINRKVEKKLLDYSKKMKKQNINTTIMQNSFFQQNNYEQLLFEMKKGKNKKLLGTIYISNVKI